MFSNGHLLYSILDVLVVWCQNQDFSTNINLKMPNNNTYNTRGNTKQLFIIKSALKIVDENYQSEKIQCNCL